VGFQQDISTRLGRKKDGLPLVATFTSSRSNRAKSSAMTVEDFMDEEDLLELAESQPVMAFGRSRTRPETHPDLVYRSPARSRSDLCQIRPGLVPRSPVPR